MDRSTWQRIPVGTLTPPKDLPDLVQRITMAAESAGLGSALRWITASGGLFARDTRVFAAYEHGFVLGRKDVAVIAWSDIEVCRMVDTADARGTYRFTGWVEITAGGRRIVLKPKAGDLPLPAEQLQVISTTLLLQYHADLEYVATEALRATGRFSFGAAEISADGVRAGEKLLPWPLVGPATIVHGHLYLYDTSGSSTPAHTISGSTVKSTTVLAELIDRLAAEHRDHGRLLSVAATTPAATAKVTVANDPSFTRPTDEDELLALIEATASAKGLHDPRRWWLAEQTGAARVLPRSGIVLYTNGFALAVSKRKAYAATWADVTELFWQHRPLATAPGTLVQFFVAAGQASFDLNSDGTGTVPLRDFTRIARPLEDAYVGYLREHRPVRYRKWELGAEGLSTKRRSIPWAQIAGAEYDGVQLTLLTADGKRTQLGGPDIGCPLGFALALEHHGVPLTRTRLVLR